MSETDNTQNTEPTQAPVEDTPSVETTESEAKAFTQADLDKIVADRIARERRKFEKKYDKKINDFKWIDKNIIKKKGIDEILSKGRGAYYSSGSRPNQTPESWALARLASVIMNGNARKVDKKIWDKYKR